MLVQDGCVSADGHGVGTSSGLMKHFHMYWLTEFFYFYLCIYFKDYLFESENMSRGEGQRQRSEADSSQSREPKVGLYPGTLGS